ncbi:type IV pilus assembly protein PilM, partial [Patescibacteria group bacterium]
LGIDIGSSSIKVVQLKKKKGKAVLETYGELSTGPYSNTEIGRATNLPTPEITKALKELIKEAKVDAKQCGISIPLKSSMIFTIDLPAVESRQLDKMVPLEARKYVPVPISEVALDWRIIPESQNSDISFEESHNEKIAEKDKVSGKVKVLVVAIHKTAIRNYEEVAKELGLELRFLEIEIFSTIRSVIGRDISTVAILDIGAGKSKLYIIEYGVVRESHIINRGSQSITLAMSRSGDMSFVEAEKVKRNVGLVKIGDESSLSIGSSLNLDYIFNESARVMRRYQSKNNKNISKVILAGGGVVMTGMLDYASKVLESDIVISDPFSKVEAPAFLIDALKEVGPEFSVSLGLALRGLRLSE